MAFTSFGGTLPLDDNDTLYYHMANDGTDLDRYHQLRILSAVWSAWEYHLWPFRFIHTEDINKADHLTFWAKDDIITFRDGRQVESDFKFLKNPGVLAVQFSAPSGSMILNDNYDYSLDAKGPNSFDLEKVMKHELGHYMGLGHSKAPSEIMGASYDENATLTEDSIIGVQTRQAKRLQIAATNNPAAKRFTKHFVMGVIDKPKRKRSCLQRLGLKR